MNKKKFARITAMYKDGVSDVVCVAAMIQMCTSSTQAAIWISKFFNLIIKPLKQENIELQIKLATPMEEQYVESPNTEEPSNLEHK